MPIWKITSDGPVKVIETKPKKEKILEEKLEDWIIDDPSLLGEPLLIIGRQVIIPEIKDRLDILALDPQGKSVIIELKRGKLKDPVDMQALRYASYISKWGFEDFERQAKLFIGKEDKDFNFNNEYEDFCSNAGVDEAPDINFDQKIIIVGAETKDKLGSVALWLLEHNIDIKVIEIELYKEEGKLLVQPLVIIPLPVSKFKEVGRIKIGDTSKPWLTESKTWHLEKRCSLMTKELLININNIIKDNFEVDGPRWNQKHYVAYRVNNYNWLSINTHASTLKLRFLVNAKVFNRADIANQLNVQEFLEEDSLSEKIGLPSSVAVKNRSESTDIIVLRTKADFDLGNEQFLKFLTNTYKEFPKSS